MQAFRVLSWFKKIQSFSFFIGFVQLVQRLWEKHSEVGFRGGGGGKYKRHPLNHILVLVCRTLPEFTLLTIVKLVIHPEKQLCPLFSCSLEFHSTWKSLIFIVSKEKGRSIRKLSSFFKLVEIKKNLFRRINSVEWRNTKNEWEKWNEKDTNVRKTFWQFDEQSIMLFCFDYISSSYSCSINIYEWNES